MEVYPKPPSSNKPIDPNQEFPHSVSGTGGPVTIPYLSETNLTITDGSNTLQTTPTGLVGNGPLTISTTTGDIVLNPAGTLKGKDIDLLASTASTPQYLSITKTGTQALTLSTANKITWQNGSGTLTGFVSNSDYTIQTGKAGFYLIIPKITVTATGGDEIDLSVYIDGVAKYTGSFNNYKGGATFSLWSATLTYPVYLTAGQKIAIYLYPTGVSAGTVSADAVQTNLHIIRLG